ncbi:MAG TPA: hypothetical protein PLZ08_01570 [Bacillota bacterium]|nr:hypothetical protein [Bacillota bacterium]HOL08666.1 hypothetical protein [Bacillota bacterium]HPO96632.1 hypothetical protein [Bacillota bacterium]
MQPKIFNCLLIILILSLIAITNPINTETRQTLTPSIRSVQYDSLVVLTSISRTVIQDLFKDLANNTFFPPVDNQRTTVTINYPKPFILFILCQFIFWFSIFYQSARTSYNQDEPLFMVIR